MLALAAVKNKAIDRVISATGFKSTDEDPVCPVFVVGDGELGKDAGYQAFISLLKKKPPSNVFDIEIESTAKVSTLKKLIKVEKTPEFDDIAADKLTLWCVSIPIDAAKKHEQIFLDPIISKEELLPTRRLSKVFAEELPEDTVHVIVQRPQQVHAPISTRVTTPLQAHSSDESRPDSPLSEIMHIIKEIQSIFRRRSAGSDSTPLLSDSMPWHERPMEAAIDRVVENVVTCLAWQKDLQVAKTESSFLVCSGTAGIGKTRYGRELYNALKSRLSPAARKKNRDYIPYYYYMLLDFSDAVNLDPTDISLGAEIILGLRLAYSHFFQGNYEQRFPSFRSRALKHKEFFSIDNVISAIRQDLKLPEQQPLFLFLHIDEFQRIFDYRWEGIPKGSRPVQPSESGIRLAGDKTEHHTVEGLSLFKDMMRSLGSYMSGAIKPSMVQTFLSGTARQDVTLAAEPTFYSFNFVSCPTLSMGACYDIMAHFAGLSGIACSRWMPTMAFFHLLSATGGLPRALQLLLEEFFGRELEKCNAFVDRVGDINMNIDQTFSIVANRLDSHYAITTFAQKHKELVHALVRLCILQRPSERTHAPSNKSRQLTLDVLERDTHMILEVSKESPGKVLVRIPCFFLHLYNTVTGDIRDRLGSAFLKDWEQDHEWRFFERIIAEYERLRTCLLIGGGCEETTLGEIYQGALGRPETLGHIVKLRRLKVVEADRRFPATGGLSVQGQELDWKSDAVIRNADGTQFGDVFVYREGTGSNGDNFLCALQAKKLGSPVSANLIKLEHKKNMDAIRKIPDGSILDKQGLKRARIITVLITTADVTDQAFQHLGGESFPEDCLLIYRGNFTKFFGDTFGVHAALSMTKDLNWNFATRETLKKKHGLDAEEVDEVLKNLPYRSYDDLIRKVPAMSSKGLDKEMGFLPYQDFLPEKRRRVR
ncbi:hypothetical protein BGX28_005852 [Mortierella sp. GBA30]|nr:hypothetical protein BGX28_005852 [Mortierella sp. GBA30]